MKKLLSNFALLGLMTVISFTYANARPSPANIHTDGTHGFTERQKSMGSPSSYLDTGMAKAKTAVGIDTMCLAMDLRDVKFMVETAMTYPDLEEEAKSSIEMLLYHLEGSSEGSKLEALSNDEKATLNDYLNVLTEIETSLQSRYSDEELWAFNAGLLLSDAYTESLFGTDESFRNSLKELQDFLREGEGYGSEQEIEALETIAKFVEKQAWTAKDYEAFDNAYELFIGLYFEIA